MGLLKYNVDDFFEESGDEDSASAHHANAQPLKSSTKRCGGNRTAEADNARHYICDEFLCKDYRTSRPDKAERGTVENVMDPRTRLILYKMVRSGFLQAVHGCLSTGKEANVYYSTQAQGDPVAIKVYRTAILLFKDRERYVRGDFRFQRYCKTNPRKMVRAWAEKEARNLRRLEAAKILAPRVLQLRLHILVMTFLGSKERAWERLHDVRSLRERFGLNLYRQAIQILKDMYQLCRLVHGDFSEFNLLVEPTGEKQGDPASNTETLLRTNTRSPRDSYDDEVPPRLYVIDVSQSVEPDHPNASTFLRRDIANVNRLFVQYIPPEERATVENIYRYVTGKAEILAVGIAQGSDPLRDKVFEQIPLPNSFGNYTTAHCSEDVERQYDELKQTPILESQFKEMCIKEIENANLHEKMKISIPSALCDEVKEDDAHSSSSIPLTHQALSETEMPYVRAGKSKDERKSHRKEIKVENRERRKQKVPKHLKKKGKARKQVEPVLVSDSQVFSVAM